MIPRLLLAAPLVPGDVALDAAQEHYLRNVLRLRAGDTVEAFDGQGHSCAGIVQPAGRSGRRLNLTLTTEPVSTPPPPRRLQLAFAVLKPAAQDQVLRKATELGATDLRPLLTARTQQGKQRDPEQRREHWLSIIESAAAQCQQNHLPRLHAAQSFDALLNERLETTSEEKPGADGIGPEQWLLLEPTGEPWPATLSKRDTLLMIGPEGGWSPAELSQAQAAGVPLVRMGSLVLRAETAPLAALVRVAAAWGDS